MAGYQRENLFLNFSQGPFHPSNNVMGIVGPIRGFAGVNVNPPGPIQPFPHSPVLNPVGPAQPMHPSNNVMPMTGLYPGFNHESMGESVSSPVGHPFLPNAHRGMDY